VPAHFVGTAATPSERLELRRNLVAFAACAALAAVSVGPAAAEENARGTQLYQLCAQCHGPQGLGNPMILAPAIAGLSEWYVAAQLEKFRSGARGLHPDDTGGLRMYPMSLSLRRDDDLVAVASYVADLPPEKPPETLQGGDASRGQALYAPCIACHGPKAGGLEDLEGPSLNHASDWYLLRQLENFKDSVRGTDPADVSGSRMRPMAMVLADQQAMKDVIAYIMTLAP